MKKILVLFLGLILLTSSLASSGIVTFKIGYFIPQANSDLWETEFDQMNFRKNDYPNTNFGFSYEYFLTKELSFFFSLDGYTKNKSGSYNGYVGYSDVDGEWAYPDDYLGDYIPGHSFNIAITPIQLSIKFTPMGRRGKFIPYIGGGVGLYFWSVRLRGDTIDFSDEWYDPVEEVIIYPINRFTDVREESRISTGWHAFGGIMFPVARKITLEAEFKYNSAKGKFPEDDPNWGFHGFDPFDLSGYQISFGLNYWF